MELLLFYVTSVLAYWLTFVPSKEFLNGIVWPFLIVKEGFKSITKGK